MMRVRTLVLVLVAVLVASLAGCSEDGTVVLPEDPLCSVFAADDIALMLPQGEYKFNWNGEGMRNIWYEGDYVYLHGDCVISSGQVGYLGVLTDLVSSFTEGAPTGPIDTGPCDDIPVTLNAGSVGRLITSGGCTRQESSHTFYEAWALYWGGRYNYGRPAVTKINVSIIPRKGRDGVQDAAQVIQMLLDFIDQSYRADPSAASTETTPPGATPVPSSTPS